MRCMKLFCQGCSLLLALIMAITSAGSYAEDAKKPVSSAANQNATAPQAAAAFESDANEYHINPMDLLEIKVLQAPDMARSVRVDARGNVSLPLIGVVPAAGLTSYELEQSIATKLAQDMIRDPQVSVFIKEFTSQRVTVQGFVLRPGVYDFQGRATLLQAISMGGGLVEKADQNHVKVIRRKSATTGADETIVYDLVEIRKSGSPDPVLKGGDVVVVEEAAPITVEGAVARPGVLYPRGRATLMMVISQSGGLLDLADPSEIKIFSPNETGQQVKLAYDYNLIQDGKLKDPEVRPGDTVVVEKSALRSAIKGVTDTIRGFVSPIK
jgi:polysaccharide biosynthesis/export protein